jgi:alpha-L-rhamnosidase
MSKIAGALGQTSEKVNYAAKADSMKLAINTRLINAQGVYIDGLKADGSQSTHVSQHANMFPLALGIVPDKNVKAVTDSVKAKKMSVGMVTVRFLPQAIGEAGEAAHLLELYTNPAWDGWAQTISKGGTLTWEAWDADKANESMSHPWGAIGLYGIQQYILGLTTLKPQHELVQIKPLDFEGKLKNAEGLFPTDKGDIKLGWTRESNRFIMNVTLPDNVKARVLLPKSGTNGNVVKVDGKDVTATESGQYLVLENVGSGTHRFERAGKTL